MSRPTTQVLLVGFSFLLLATLTVSLAAAQKAPTFTTIDFPGATETVAYDISTSGTIVGTFTDANGLSHGFTKTSGGTFQTLDVPGASATMAYGADDVATVGSYIDTAGTHGFMFDTTFTIIDPPGSAATTAWSIDERGGIVGSYADSTGRVHAFRHVVFSTGYTTYDAPNGAQLTAFTGIDQQSFHNKAGYYIDASGIEHGFNLHGAIPMGKFTDVTVPGAGIVVTAINRINDTEESVGYFGTNAAGPFTGFRRSGSGKFHRVTFPGASDTRCHGVNNSGVIVGQYTDSAGVIHGFQMTP